MIDYKLKPLIPLMFRIPGVAILLCGLFFIGTFSHVSILGIFLTLTSIPIVFTKNGILMDSNKKRIKNYIGLFKLKAGRWKAIDNYPFVTLLHLNLVSRGESNSGLNFYDKQKVYRICLLNENHREKVKIVDFTDLDKAIIEVNKIAKSFDIRFTKYSPL
ncbi:hypothetical protein JJL45_11830 [Tamlana sp. s12]|uniref:hypothetical protein n=1 Tax=Tamlana sp. s12 TaxID=1630406 RepID=UPI0007FF546D|nr:hypothetical protein [Tamlana sp. s12]OBQ50303.1 hypothetical protein VQ01_15400 [Tamlana sp. s12]QQY81612.1 hypothetical protein JJL45_11830 [Tamlana sp. s12]